MLACAGDGAGGQGPVSTVPQRPAWLRACTLSTEPALCGSVAVPESPGDPATRTLVVPASEAGERLDRVLANHVTELSRSRLKALILAGQVTIGG